MVSRLLQQKNQKIKVYRMKKRGKLTGKQIAKDRAKFVSNQVINTGRGPDMHAMREYKARSGGTLFRTRTGGIFVAKDPLEEFFASKLTERKYTVEEIKTLDVADKDGWRKSEPIPLSEVRRRLDKLAGDDDILKWQHFMLPKTSVHTALFFSPQKDKWFYIEINPETGMARRTVIYSCKEVAEFKRKRKILTWIPLTSNPIVI